MCGEPAKTMGWWNPGRFYTAVIPLKFLSSQPADSKLSEFPSGSEVFYRVASHLDAQENVTLWSPMRSFRVPSAPGAMGVIKAVLAADMGATTREHISQHWAGRRKVGMVLGVLEYIGKEIFIVGEEVKVLGLLRYGVGY